MNTSESTVTHHTVDCTADFPETDTVRMGNEARKWLYCSTDTVNCIDGSLELTRNIGLTTYFIPIGYLN